MFKSVQNMFSFTSITDLNYDYVPTKEVLYAEAIGKGSGYNNLENMLLFYDLHQPCNYMKLSEDREFMREVFDPNIDLDEAYCNFLDYFPGSRRDKFEEMIKFSHSGVARLMLNYFSLKMGINQIFDFQEWHVLEIYDDDLKEFEKLKYCLESNKDELVAKIKETLSQSTDAFIVKDSDIKVKMFFKHGNKTTDKNIEFVESPYVKFSIRLNGEEFCFNMKHPMELEPDYL